MIRELLTLGNEKLYETSAEARPDEMDAMRSVARDLRDTLADYRKKHGAGRAIAATQIGVQKRLIYMEADRPTVLINPVITFPDDETMEVMDDCMSFPNLLVRVRRHQRCAAVYLDLDGKERTLRLEGDLAELLRHEYDHLDGILATMRAVDAKSFYPKPAACKARDEYA